MIRRLNYTNRFRIPRKAIRIVLWQRHDEQWFDADLSGLSTYREPPYAIPNESLVYLEAYRQTDWMRFGFGTFGNVSPAEDRRLSHFSSAEGVKFRLKITASLADHRILAEADAIPLFMSKDEPQQRNPLLTVVPTPDLGDEIFRLDFAGEQIVLLMNSDAGNYRDIGRSPAFMSLALPALFREILTRILLIDRGAEEYGTENWHTMWIRFALQHPGLGEVPPEDADEERLDWIDRAVAAFSRRQRSKARFLEFWRTSE